MLYSTDEAARKTGQHPSNVRRLARKGRAGRRIGGRWLFDDDDLNALAVTSEVGRPRGPVGDNRPCGLTNSQKENDIAD